MTIHTSINSKTSRPLSDDEIRAIAPSVFAEGAHESRSERYAYIPTTQLLAEMRREGFEVFSARQGRCRLPGKADFTKHMLRFRREGSATARKVGDSVPEVALLNSHDGTSRYVLSAALLRLVCDNGLMVSDSTFEPVRVGHTGNAIAKVIEGSYRVLGESERILDVSARWASLQLTEGERLAFAEAARVARFGDAEGEVTTPVQANQLLVPRRYGDDRADLWTTFNVIQENAIRGGLTARGVDANGRRRRVTSRAVTGIDGDVKLNKALWTLAEALAASKAA